VTDSVTGLPLEGASVYLSYYVDAHGGFWEDIDGVSTYADGSYDLFNTWGPEDNDQWRIEAVRDGYEPYTHDFIAEVGVYEHNFTMVPEGGLVLAEGAVEDAITSVAIEGAFVEAEWYDVGDDTWEWAAMAYTDEHGAYTLYDTAGLGAGEYRFTSGTMGYSRQSRTETWDGVTPLKLDFALQPAPVIATGTVTNAMTGEGIESAQVEVRFWDGLDWKVAALAEADASGAYTLYDHFGYGARGYSFLATASGYQIEVRHAAWDGVTPLFVHFELAPVADGPDAYEPDDISSQAKQIPTDGTVQERTLWPQGDVDWATFEAQAGTTYVIETSRTYGTTDTYLYLYDSDATTELASDDDGGDGWFSRIEWTAPADQTIYVRVEYFFSSGVGYYGLSVMEPEPAPIASGTVTDASTGEPIEGAWVAAGWYDAGGGHTADLVETDANGSYTLVDRFGYGEGEYRFQAGASGYQDSEFLKETWDGETPLDLDFTLVPIPASIPIEGLSRFHTAVAASQEAYPDGSQYVIIATGRNWPDALGGAALAGVLDAPILLSEPTSLPSVTKTEIERLEATHAIILGGTGAVSAGVQTTLATTMGLSVERIEGLTRYQTADKIALRVIELQPGYGGTAFVATGGDFPDALAAAPLAAANGWPLFLAHPTTGLSDATKAAMTGVTRVRVLGGTGAVSPATYTYLSTRFGAGNVDRLAGDTRYSTAVAIASWGVSDAGLGWDRVGIATGQDYPDALAGGVLQGKVGSVMLLTLPTTLHASTATALSANADAIDTVTFFGGTGAVSTAVRTAVLQLVQ
jgi:putative cell wall-binding protein